MCKTTGNKELAFILTTQFHHHMLAKSRRTLTDIHRHIQDAALDNTHQFCLRVVPFLIMQSTQHATSLEGLPKGVYIYNKRKIIVK